MGATSGSRGWLGSCTPTRHSPWPAAAPESQKSEEGSDKAEGKAKGEEGTLFLSHLKEQSTFPLGQCVPHLKQGDCEGVRGSYPPPPLVICGL